MTVPIVDLRSDTVTKPTPAMRDAMMRAEVGDDVYLEDPTVNLLEAKAAELLGFEASLFFPTGSMGNQVAINIHARPGTEVICEEQGHIYNYEMATMAAISGALARPVPGQDGFLTAALVDENIRPSIYYRAQTSLVSLENTHNLRGGRVHPLEWVREIIALCKSKGIPVHLDGARIFNAAIASGKPARELVQGFDSVMFCLSKGLGAPIGSMLCGSRPFIERARAVRKLFGGGMRQVGILAAAGLYALEQHIERLAEDHARARKLALALAEIPFVGIDVKQVQTNILVFSVDEQVIDAYTFATKLKERGVLCGPFSRKVVRMVTHLDIDDAALDRAIGIMHELFAA